MAQTQRKKHRHSASLFFMKSTYTIPVDLRQLIDNSFCDIVMQFHHSTESRILKKHIYLNHGPLYLRQHRDGYVNLTNYSPTPDQTKLLNLGLDCLVLKKPGPHQKRVEIEIHLKNIYAPEKLGKVSTTPNLPADLLSEAGKSRGSFKSQLIDENLKKAARELQENEHIVVRRADKSAVYVLMTKEEYLQKMSTILGDTSKFQRISQDPSNKLKVKCNSIIDTINAKKRRNTLTTHNWRTWTRSPKEFIDLLHNKAPTGLIASLDAESLFTNVPVNETINFILDEVYHSNHVPLDIPETLLRKLLEACTTESPFRGPDGKLYRQVDGVAMGSPLGVLFANFYMGLVERRVFSDPLIRPHSYGRYVDDIFVEARDHTHLLELCESFATNSCLNFTSERHADGSLPFLDIFVKPDNSGRSSLSESGFLKEFARERQEEGMDGNEKVKKLSLYYLLKMFGSLCIETKNIDENIKFMKTNMGGMKLVIALLYALQRREDVLV
ncbi:uncharacterized protein LOC143019050 [Oratosquilla oratoria]|uniref:uncharacterized protein LOC143019050 n=1 Tax=Oratosquilla oratoria TaxID=337810 RepID=UPI003F75C75A